MRLNALRTLDVTEPMSSGHAFISAASGLVRLGDAIYLIADDEHHLIKFDLGSLAPGHLVRLRVGDLPSDAAARKAVKPDFEILFQLPPLPNAGTNGAIQHRLLAMGSGSTTRRMQAALIGINAVGDVTAVTQLDLRPLFDALTPICAEINLEGAIAHDDRLILFNRGNMKSPGTHVFSASLPAILAEQSGAPVLEQQFALPYAAGVPLTVTDACCLTNDQILLSAVAEATGDSYADGTIVAAAFVLLDAQFNLLRTEAIEPICKIEGISAQMKDEDVHILCVTDADDPNKPSTLYSAILPNIGPT